MTRKLALTLFAAFAIVFLAGFPVRAAEAQVTDLTALFRSGGMAIDNLQVLEVGGIVVIRGATTDRTMAAAASGYAATHGYTRVANLVQITGPIDDASIQRAAEREISVHRGLDDCKFQVSSHNGVIHIAGQVHQELQKEMAVQLLRNLDGVKGVKADLSRF
jgi:osmotically-inducible protein OsmY